MLNKETMEGIFHTGLVCHLIDLGCSAIIAINEDTPRINAIDYTDFLKISNLPKGKI